MVGKQRAVITITEHAIARLRHLLSKTPQFEYVRLGVRRRGCSGLSYTLDYTNEREQFDELVERDGVRVLIRPNALLSVVGTEMDFCTDRLRSEFVFRNPNAKGECGCGESFVL